MKKLIIHIAFEEYMLWKDFQEDSSIIRKFSEEEEIHNIFFYPSKKEPPILLNSKSIEVRNFASDEELENAVELLSKRYKVLLITSPYDVFVKKVNDLRQSIWQKVSDNTQMFNDKSIQRELLYKNDLYVSVNYLKIKLEDLDYNYIVEKIWVPFILKPVNGKLSMWVVKIKTEKNLERYLKNFEELHNKIVETWLWDTSEFVAEEFINGELYSVDYFVNENSEVIMSRPVRVKLWADIDINDFCNISRLATKDVEKEYDMVQVEEFVKRNVKATWMRNTFVHHEFKINKKWIYKTIELNWRIWGKRLSIYNSAYGVNLYSFLLWEKIEFELKNNVAYFRIFACKRWILKSFNEKVLEKIEKLNSFHKIARKEWLKWKEIWLTKDWFWYAVSIELKNENLKELEKDIKYIEDNYCDILEIE